MHTTVPAGHDYFDEALFGKYMNGYPALLGISWDEFIGMGRENPDDHTERFCMSTFACNTSQEVNGVSKLHGWVSQKMFAPIWQGYYPEAVSYTHLDVYKRQAQGSALGKDIPTNLHYERAKGRRTSEHFAGSCCAYSAPVS